MEIGREIPETKNVTIRYATNEEGVKEEEFDLVVLGVGLGPPADVKRLADRSIPSRPPARVCSSAAPSRGPWTSPNR